MSSNERDSFQLTLRIGEGVAGAERRQAMEKAASVARKTLSAWARAVLCAAAGMPGEELVTRAELDELERRVEALERRSRKQ